MSHTRLALTYQKMGREDLYQENIVKALARAKKAYADRIRNEQELIDTVKKLDKEI